MLNKYFCHDWCHKRPIKQMLTNNNNNNRRFCQAVSSWLVESGHFDTWYVRNTGNAFIPVGGCKRVGSKRLYFLIIANLVTKPGRWGHISPKNDIWSLVPFRVANERIGTKGEFWSRNTKVAPLQNKHENEKKRNRIKIITAKWTW